MNLPFYIILYNSVSICWFISSLSAAWSFHFPIVVTKKLIKNSKSRSNQPAHPYLISNSHCREFQLPITTVVQSSKNQSNQEKELMNNTNTTVGMMEEEGGDDDQPTKKLLIKSSNKKHNSRLLHYIGTSTSAVVSFTFFAVLALKRDAFMICFFTGSILNAIASKVLKRIINEARPEALQFADSIKEKPKDPGMPSSHATSLGFIGSYTALKIPFLVVPLLIYVTVSLFYRVQINLHTKEQVYAGLVLGVTNAIIWNSLTFGTNALLPNICILDNVSSMLPQSDGMLPLQFLIIPAALGAAIVGSFERKISRWVQKWGLNHYYLKNHHLRKRNSD